MIRARLKLVAVILILGFIIFSGCEKTEPQKKEVKSTVVKKKISVQVPEPTDKTDKKETQAKNETLLDKDKAGPIITTVEETVPAPEIKEEKSKPLTIIVKEEKTQSPSLVNIKPADPQAESVEKSEAGTLETKLDDTKITLTGIKFKETVEHYKSQGKIDPFKPLIQDEPEETVVKEDKRPPRILTPLEKIDLSQIKLVAVVQMKNKKIAMVEEASGKGYEVGVGTYIGTKQGRITEIKDSSIVVKELSQDFKGRPREFTQEIKLNKFDEE